MKSIVVAVLFLSAPLLAQQGDPTFRSKAELVQVPVVVTRDHQPLTGLSAKDFRLLNDGKPQEIAVFEEVDAVAARMTEPQLPPRTVQNFASADSRQDVVILLLDFLNASASTRARIRSYLPDMVRQFVDSRTPISVLLLTRDGLIQVHSFTSDPANLVSAVEQWSKNFKVTGEKIQPTPPGWSTPFSPTGLRQSAQTLEEYGPFQSLSSFTVREVGAITAGAAQQIAQSYGGLPGRKKLIWMSTRFVSGTSVTSFGNRGVMDFEVVEMEERSWRALSAANIVVYPIDSNGSVNPDWEARFSAQHAGERLESFFPIISRETQSDVNGLRLAAEKTGGTACTIEPNKCIQSIQTDAGHYYLLGFYLKGTPKPGWHSINVKVDQPKANARARQGYVVADPANPQRGSREEARRVASQKDAVLTALASPLDYTFLSLRLQWSKTADGKIELVLSTPPGSITIDDNGAMDLDYLAAARLSSKTEAKSFPATLAAKLSPQQQKVVETSGFLYRKKIDLAPGRYELRVFLRDNLSQKIGTVSTAIEVTAN